MSSNRNVDVLEHMVRFCNEIRQTQEHFGTSLEALQSSAIYRNAAAMCILQIGELTTHLSDDFRAIYTGMPWQDIKAMRNIAAHHYGNFDTKKLWETITEDIPELQKYCEEILSQHAVLEQEVLPEPDDASELSF